MSGVEPQPDNTITVYAGTAKDAIVAKGRTDSSGAFAIDLPPGTYTVVWWPTHPEIVTVEPGKYVTLDLVMQGK